MGAIPETVEKNFYSWIKEETPYLSDFFDEENKKMDLRGIATFIATAPRQKMILAKFAMAIWKREHQGTFDIFQAVSNLDDSHLGVIIDWIESPVWPTSSEEC